MFKLNLTKDELDVLTNVVYSGLQTIYDEKQKFFEPDPDDEQQQKLRLRENLTREEVAAFSNNVARQMIFQSLIERINAAAAGNGNE